MTQYPPFYSLVAFEAAARHRNMTLAADELGLTQSAVSHRIRRLEEFMGVPLLKRLNAGLELTSHGEAILGDTADILEDLENLRTNCIGAETSNSIRVGIGSALADNWLVRRLPEFSKRYPDITIELMVVENEAPERIGDLDIRILWLRQDDIKGSSTQKQLFQENVFPVCHPSLLPDDYTPGDGTILKKLPLLHKGSSGYNAGAEWEWSTWFKQLKLGKTQKPSLRFTSIGPAISAALEGAGAVIARSMLVQDTLADGRLVRILPEERDMLSSKVHIARWPARLSGNEEVKNFISWLVKKSHEDAEAIT